MAKKKMKTKLSTTLKERKDNFLELFEATHGNVKKVCETLKMSRQTYYAWYKKYPKFKEAVDEILAVNVDYVEDKLFDLIDAGNYKAIQFYLKTKGKNFGYSERTDVEVSGSISQDIVIKPFNPSPGKNNKIDDRDSSN